MIILMLLILQLFLLFKSTQFNKSFMFVVISSLCWNLCWLIVLQLEFAQTGVFTYGSDETAYLNTMQRAVDSEEWFKVVSEDFNFTYVLFGTLVLKTSFIQDVFIVRLCNIMLLVNTIAILYLLLTRTFSIQSKVIYWGLMFVGLNGIITWTAIRNVKDTLFVYMFMVVLYLVLEWFFNKKRSLWRILSIASACYVLQDIRQWFVYMGIILLVSLVAYQLIKKKRFVLLTFLVGGALYASIEVFRKGLATLMIYTLSYSEFQTSTGGDSITGLVNANLLSLPVAMGRFILGPGPIRALFGSEAFLTSTTTGNVLIFFGGLMWWAVLPLFLLALLSFNNFKQMYLVLIAIIFYWATYSYAYAGSGDTRLRAILYILCMLYTVPYIVNHFKRRQVAYYALLFFPIILIGSYFSYISLA